LVEDFNKNNQDGNHDEDMEQLVTRHVSGRLKVAPEHTSDATLKVMRKPGFKYFRKFKDKYDKIQKKHGLKQPLIPYFISSHPGCEEADMANLAAETKDLGFKLEQVQDFTPTPMTVAEVIYYTGVHPYTLQPIHTAKTKEEKLTQNKYFFWYKPEVKGWIKSRLLKLGHKELAAKLLSPIKPQNQEIKKVEEVQKKSTTVMSEKPNYNSKKPIETKTQEGVFDKKKPLKKKKGWA
jgi:radical SAM superfamily enzyme YgiQ (UPF0313 family)